MSSQLESISLQNTLLHNEKNAVYEVITYGIEYLYIPITTYRHEKLPQHRVTPS